MAISIREALRGVVLAALAGLAASGQAYAGDDTQASGHGFADVNGTRLYYEVRGKGPALVLIHGGQQDSRIWDDLLSPAVPRPGKTQADATNAPGTAFCPSVSPDG